MTKYKIIEPTEETINFEFHLLAEYWNLPPFVQILVDEEEKYFSSLKKGINVVKFTHTCSFNHPHKLTLIRSGNSNSQTKMVEGKILEQRVAINQLLIDDINVERIMYIYSETTPIYPEPWASEQRAKGIRLEEKIKGETWFGHNCTWELNFTSPFYKFIMAWMGGPRR